jgi:PAS domain S-box-containing protein
MPDVTANPLAGIARRPTVLVAVVGAVGVWVLDSFLDSVVLGEGTVVEQLLSPSVAELWVRGLVAALAVLLYRSRGAARQLRLLSSALATSPDGIQITNLDGIVTYSNEAVREIYGFSPAELEGKHVNEMNAEPTFATRVILPALAKTGRWVGELEVKHKDGHVFPIWLTTSVVLDHRGKPLGAIGVIRDLSDRMRSEQELREYARQLEEATALKDLFADILRHDLLGPAATVQLSLDSLLRREAEPVVARRIMEGARRSCAKLIEMIEGAAKYAKLSAPQQIDFGTVELGSLLKEIVRDMELRRQERNASITLEASGEYPVRANPTIAEVFENLVSNALKYGGPNSTIRIHVRDEDGRWRVSIADRGEGIADADKQKLFTRFERLRKEGVKGTGLGLAIAKRIVDLHGGSIWVEDNPGGGSVFCVTLPKTA